MAGTNPDPVSAKLALVEPPVVADPVPDFETLYGREFSYVYRTLRRLGVRAADVEDLVHDVFVVVHRRLPDFDAARPVRPWLFGIAYRVASDHRRLARHVREVGVDFPHARCEAPDPEARAQAAEARDLVLEALDALDLDRRAVLVMHDIDGHAVPEIAAALDVPLNTVYSRLRIARERFEAAVRRITARRASPARRAT